MTYLPTISIQTHYFLYSLCLGCIIGIIYDVLRLFREMGNWGRKPHFYLSDILIFIIAAFLFEIYTISFGYGKIRYYALLGSFLGFVIYINTLGSLTFSIEKRFARGLHWIIHKLFRIFVLKPLFFFVKVLKKLKSILYNILVMFRKKLSMRKLGEDGEEEKEKQ